MSENPVPPIDGWVAENYDTIVADKNSGRSWKDIEKMADENNDRTLAAYARAKAAGKGGDVTPEDATDGPKKVTRVTPKGKNSQELTTVDVPVTEPVGDPIPAPEPDADHKVKAGK